MKKLIFTLFVSTLINSLNAQISIVSIGNSWKYLANGTDQGTNWRNIEFNDELWLNGNSQLGYGESDEATVISYGSNSSAKYPTTYFRKSITISNTAQFQDYTLNVKRDDGVIVYVNGVEIFRDNMGTGTALFTSYAPSNAADDGQTWLSATLNSTAFIEGNNTIAVEIHQSTASSSDLSFDLKLTGNLKTQITTISSGNLWKYLANGIDQGINWRNVGFNDNTWSTGNSELGYGENDEATIVSYGPNSATKYPTTYFRKVVNILNASQYQYTLNVKRDDGIIVYINGIEVFRDNMGTGTKLYSSYASGNAADDGATWITSVLSSTAIVEGNNTIAVEIHQSTASSSDLTFDLKLEGLLKSSILATSTIKDIRWGSQNDPINGLTVTWTNAGLNDLIQWGYTTNLELGTFPGIKRNGNALNSYFTKYTFPSVQTNSTIYYKLFDSNINVWSETYSYKTAPPINTESFCFLGVGDSRSGMETWAQIATLAHSKDADFTIYNGDIVSNAELDSDWDKWFLNGKKYIQNNLIYHSMGNHDEGTSNKYSNTLELPQTNGTNLYYSFNYGNSLFICINTEDPSNVSQYNWLINTLQANQNATWKVVFFHRPFYTIGVHAGEMDPYFNTIWKAFDDYGVDLIVNGHDHMYERTKPINRNVSTTSPVTQYGSEPGQGRCQIVCGGAGAPLKTGIPTNFIQTYQSKYNFSEFCINGNALNCTTYDNNNAIIESFSLSKSGLKSAQSEIKETKEIFNPIEIYPNPAKNNFTLKTNSLLKGEGVINIVDINGTIVKKENVMKYEANFEYHLNDLNIAPGSYFIEIIFEEHKDTIMLLID